MPPLVLILAIALGSVTTGAIGAHNRHEYGAFARRVGWLVGLCVVGMAMAVDSIVGAMG